MIKFLLCTFYHSEKNLKESISHKKLLDWEKVCIWLKVQTTGHLSCTLMLSDLEVKSCPVTSLPGMEMASCQRSGKSQERALLVFSAEWGQRWRQESRALLEPVVSTLHFSVSPNLTACQFCGRGSVTHAHSLSSSGRWAWNLQPSLSAVCVHAQSCLTLSDPMDCSPRGPLSMGFSRQEYWSGLPFPPPGDLPIPGTEPLALAGEFFISKPPGKRLQGLQWGLNGLTLSSP